MLQIILKETREFLRDKSNVFFFFIFPVVLVFLLGNLLASMDNAEEVIGEVNIHYVIETESAVDIASVKEFIKGVEDNKNIFFEESDDLDASVRMVSDGRADAAVLFRNDPLEIHIFEGPDRVKNRTVYGLMNGFSQFNKAVNIIAGSNGQIPAGPADYESGYIMHKDLGVSRTMLDYYAITMMTMMCFMSILLGAVCFMGERQGRTVSRLKIAPVSQVKLFFGKIFGLLPQTVLQTVILMVLSTVLFGANYAANLKDNLHLFFMFTVVSFSMISVGAVYGLFTDINPMACIMPVAWAMMFLSGTYSKEIFIDGISQYMPMYQVQEAAFDLAVFGRVQKANMVIMVCLLLSAAMLAAGALGFSRKEEK